MILCNSRLSVEIADLGTTYQGTRFDWTGFVVQVTLDHQHTFCVPESMIKGQGTGGMGLCGEFGISFPVGYHDAQPGETFPKLGVGLLTRPENEDHDFAADYEMKSFPVRTQKSDDRIVYEMDPLPCRGYEARLRKTVQIRDNILEISCELENVGTRPLNTHEYNHNFIAINGQPAGPGYMLRLADGIALPPDDLSPLWTRSDGAVAWKSPVSAEFLCPVPGPFTATGPAWELIHEPTGVGVKETVDFPIAHLGLWCAPHVIAPEVFVTISVAPGECQSWKRSYEFSKPVVNGTPNNHSALSVQNRP